MADKTLLTFFRELESEITASAQGGLGMVGDFRETALTEILATDLEETGVLESPVVCDFESGKGAGSMKCNGYSIPDEDTRLDLFVTLYQGPSDEPAIIHASDVDSAFNKLGRYLKNAFDGLHNQLEAALDCYNMTERIAGARQNIDRVNFLLFTNATLSIRNEKRRKAEVLGLPATYEVWDLERFRRFRESGVSYEALNIDLRELPQGGLDAVKLDTGDGFQTWVTAIPGILLKDLYDEYGTRLLELNVRSYLQARGKVNKGILETLKTNPEDFMAYNNGITVVAEKIVAGPLKGGGEGLLALEGMQIVNGGQTTASIHRAWKEFNADLTRVHVQGKITVVPPERFQEVVPLISRYSNSQNKVSESDLSSNHPFHVGIERMSRREWTPDQQTRWFFERARGSFQTARNREFNLSPARGRDFDNKHPVSQRFTKEDLAKFENAWLGFPHIVSRAGQKCYVNFMGRLGKYPDAWEPETETFRRYIAKGILFREVQRIVRADQSITAYRIHVVAYTVALIAEKTAWRIDLDKIWQKQALSKALRDTAVAWAPVVYNHLPDISRKSGRHIEDSFKSEECWNYMRGLDLLVGPLLENELTGTELTSTPASTTDLNNIARCMALSDKQWNDVALWGIKAGALKEWQRGIARTLAGYAAEGWTKQPSQKQAKHGADMIEMARKSGII